MSLEIQILFIFFKYLTVTSQSDEQLYSVFGFKYYTKKGETRPMKEFSRNDS